MTNYEDLLFEIVRILLTVKNNKNIVKSGCFGKTLRWKALIISRNRGEL